MYLAVVCGDIDMIGLKLSIKLVMSLSLHREENWTRLLPTESCF